MLPFQALTLALGLVFHSLGLSATSCSFLASLVLAAPPPVGLSLELMSSSELFGCGHVILFISEVISYECDTLNSLKTLFPSLCPL